MIDSLLNIFGFICLGLFIIRTITYLILQVNDKTSTFFSYDFQIGFILWYDKNVTHSFYIVKKICNQTLKFGAISFIICIALTIMKNLQIH